MPDDCWKCVFEFVPTTQLLACKRVAKGFERNITDYLGESEWEAVRTLKAKEDFIEQLFRLLQTSNCKVRIDLSNQLDLTNQQAAYILSNFRKIVSFNLPKKLRIRFPGRLHLMCDIYEFDSKAYLVCSAHFHKLPQNQKQISVKTLAPFYRVKKQSINDQLDQELVSSFKNVVIDWHKNTLLPAAVRGLKYAEKRCVNVTFLTTSRLLQGQRNWDIVIVFHAKVFCQDGKKNWVIYCIEQPKITEFITFWRYIPINPI